MVHQDDDCVGIFFLDAAKNGLPVQHNLCGGLPIFVIYLIGRIGDMHVSTDVSEPLNAVKTTPLFFHARMHATGKPAE